MKILSIWVFVCIVMASNVFAGDITSVTMAAPGSDGKFAWPVLSHDGAGLYNKIYNNVFGLKDINVNIVIVPVLRCELMVMTGEADFFPGAVRDTLFQGYSFVTPKYAVWHTKGIAVLFKKKTISTWNGISSLKGKKIVSALGSDHLKELEKYKNQLTSEIENAHENPTPEGALKMVMLDYMDVYISSIEMTKVAMRAHKETFNRDEYHIEFLGRQKFYPLFQQTKKGKYLSRIFDEGMQYFYLNGQLDIWYKDSPSATLENIDPALMEK